MSEPERDPEPVDEQLGLNPHAFTPAAQGSNVPLNWKPKPNAPLPVVRCTQIKKDGERCGRWSLRGALKCVKHLANGGTLRNVEEHRQARIEAAALRLIDDTDKAVDTLEQLMEPGTGEAIRLKASLEVLDRVGIRGGFEVKVETDITESPADVIRKRIEELKKGAEAAAKMRADAEAAALGDIVDAEIVDDEQPALFDIPDAEEAGDGDDDTK